MDNHLTIAIEPGSRARVGRFPYCVGRITINDFSERFTVALDYWTEEDYLRQWREGLEIIQSEPVSCLVASVQGPYINPLVNWWLLYRDGSRIMIRNQLITGRFYRQDIGANIFSPDTCYEFIRQPFCMFPDTHEKPSEWVINL